VVFVASWQTLVPAYPALGPGGLFRFQLGLDQLDLLFQVGVPAGKGKLIEKENDPDNQIGGEKIVEVFHKRKGYS